MTHKSNQNCATFAALLLGASLLVTSVACTSVPTSDIKTQAVASPKFNLAGYKSYAWFAGLGVLNDPLRVWSDQGIDPLAETQFLLNEGLRKRGLTESGTPELIISFLLINDVQQLKELEAKKKGDVPELVGVGEGALVIEFVDAKSGQTVWLGAATAETQTGRSADVMKKRLKYAVEQVLKQLPK